MALFCAAIRRDPVTLLRFPFLSHVQFFLECDLACLLLEKSTQLFYFLFLFSGYFCSVYPYVACIFSVAVIPLPLHFFI